MSGRSIVQVHVKQKPIEKEISKTIIMYVNIVGMISFLNVKKLGFALLFVLERIKTKGGMVKRLAVEIAGKSLIKNISDICTARHYVRVGTTREILRKLRSPVLIVKSQSINLFTAGNELKIARTISVQASVMVNIGQRWGEKSEFVRYVRNNLLLRNRQRACCVLSLVRMCGNQKIARERTLQTTMYHSQKK